MIVVDASFLLTALVDNTRLGVRARTVLQAERPFAPELIDLEVLSALRRQITAGQIDAQRAEQAVIDLSDLPIVRISHVRLIGRAWQLRDNLTPYDASYVALAESLHAPLFTSDRRMAGAPGSTCEFRVFQS